MNFLYIISEIGFLTLYNFTKLHIISQLLSHVFRVNLHTLFPCWRIESQRPSVDEMPSMFLIPGHKVTVWDSTASLVGKQMVRLAQKHHMLPPTPFARHNVLRCCIYAALASVSHTEKMFRTCRGWQLHRLTQGLTSPCTGRHSAAGRARVEPFVGLARAL